MNGVGIFFIVLVVLLVAAAAGWFVFTQLRARRLGLPAPSLNSYNPFARSEPSFGASPAPGGIRGWVNDKLRPRNKRSAAGAYENTNYARGNRGFGPLDPDEAWDARVGNEADSYGPGGYYEEQELGTTNGGRSNPYTGNEYPMNIAAAPASNFGDDEERGRPRGRSPALGGSGLGVPGKGVNQNPFDDDAAEPSNISLREVDPRPIDTASAARTPGHGPASDSPSERRSMFRENV